MKTLQTSIFEQCSLVSAEQLVTPWGKFWEEHEGHMWVGLVVLGFVATVPQVWWAWREVEISEHQNSTGHILTLKRMIRDHISSAEVGLCAALDERRV